MGRDGALNADACAARGGGALNRRIPLSLQRIGIGRSPDRIVESGDNTMVCTRQFCSYRDRAEDFASLNATVVGISAQSVESHEGFIAKNNLNVPLLADVDKAVAKAYGAVMPGVGSTARAVIVIDEQGIVRHRHDHRLGLDYQTVDELREALEQLPALAG